MFIEIFFPPKIAPVYEITWKHFAQPEQATDGNIIWRVHFACWITKDTHTHIHTQNMQ